MLEIQAGGHKDSREGGHHLCDRSDHNLCCTTVHLAGRNQLCGVALTQLEQKQKRGKRRSLGAMGDHVRGR
jgi:hypothetical protein